MALSLARFLVGRYSNNLERTSVAASTLTSSGAADADYPLDRLVDLQPDKEARAAAAGADDTITADCNIVINPQLVLWSSGVPLGWTKSGTVVETTVAGEVRSNSAAKVTANASYIQQEITVRSGQRLKIDYWARISAATAVASVRIQNKETGRWLTAAGGWGTIQGALDMTSATYTQQTKEFQVESYEVCGQKDTVTLLCQFIGSGDAGDFAFFDDITLYPAFNFMAVIGHNLDPLIVPTWRTSTDAFVSVDTAVTPDHGSFKPRSWWWLLDTPQYVRWVRLKMAGTNITAPWAIGEWIVGEVRTPLQDYETIDFPSYVAWNRQMSRTQAGKRFGFRRTKHPVTSVVLTYFFTGPSAETNLADMAEIVNRSEGGTWPVIVIPDVSFPEIIHGFLPDGFSLSRELVDDFRGIEIPVDPSPYASSE